MKLILVVLYACAMVIEAIPVEPDAGVISSDVLAKVAPIFQKIIFEAPEAAPLATAVKRLLSARQVAGIVNAVESEASAALNGSLNAIEGAVKGAGKLPLAIGTTLVTTLYRLAEKIEALPAP